MGEPATDECFYRPMSEKLMVLGLLASGLVITGLTALGITGELILSGSTVSGSAGRWVAAGFCAFAVVAVVQDVGRLVLRIPDLELNDQGLTARFGMRRQRARWTDVRSVGEPVVLKAAGIRPRFLDVGLRDGGRVRVPIMLKGVSPEAVRERISTRATRVA